MKVFVAGGTGVIAQQLVPLLGEVGVRRDRRRWHDPARRVEIPGVRVVNADALDRASVRSVGGHGARRDREPAHRDPAHARLTSRRPRHGGHEPVASRRHCASRTRGACARIISEGLAYAYRPRGGPVADERRPLWSTHPGRIARRSPPSSSLERRPCEAGGTVLRLGHLYGPGTAFAPGGAVRRTSPSVSCAPGGYRQRDVLVPAHARRGDRDRRCAR